MYSKPKFWLRRLIVLLGISVMLFLYPSSAEAQTISHRQTKVSLEKLFKIIKAQTGYNVVWSDSKLDVSRTIKADFKNASLSFVMDKALAGLEAAYTIQNKSIIIKAAGKATNTKVTGSILSVKGTVMDTEGKPLPGATISVKGGISSTQAEESGRFVLSGVEGGSLLLVSYVGFQVHEVVAQEDLGIVSLRELDAKLAEVEINTGYYTVKDRERTGSITRVTSSEMERQPVNNVLESLIGRMSGVNITPSTGANGGGFTVEIRGRNSLRADGREPLYLVNGVPYPPSKISDPDIGVLSLGIGAGASPLNYLNLGDIESIEILKDADATAIYGSRGANGVVLITTKKSTSQTTSFNFNLMRGISEVGKKLSLLNTPQYLEMRNEAFTNDAAKVRAIDYDVNGAWDQTRYTDWQQQLIGGSGQATSIQAALSAGSANTAFQLRGNYNKNGTVYPGKFSDTKGSGALTISHTSQNQKFKADFSSTYGVDKNDLPQVDLPSFIFLPPNAPSLYDDKGNLNWAFDENGTSTWENPVAGLLNVYSGKTHTFLSNGLLNYEFAPGLHLQSTFGFNSIRTKEILLNPIAAQVPSPDATGLHYRSLNNVETFIIEPQLNYNTIVGKGSLNILVGTTFQHQDQQGESIAGVGYTSDLLLSNISAAPIKGGGSSSSQYRYAAVFGRANFNYLEKYIINFTGRRDGSSRFGAGRQYANFGAAGLAWIFTSEQGIAKALPFISFGKLRGSYGITGSDQIPNYGYLSTYSAFQPYIDGSSLVPSKLANPDYSWESNKKLEVAVEVNFLDDLISFSTAWYRNRSSNQLVGYSLPDVTGFSTIQFNLPAKVQNTGLELELTSKNLKRKHFSWTSGLNITIPKNELLVYPNILGSSYATTYAVGSSMYAPFGYHFLGVNEQTGLYVFEDLNANGSDVDQADKKIARRPLTSEMYGGLKNELAYLGFRLDIFIQFAKKNVRNALSNLSAPGTIGNQPDFVLSRWRSLGDRTDIQKFSTISVGGGAIQRSGFAAGSDRFSDASFIRLKNVSLSWNAPNSFLQKVGLKQLRIYAQGQNLFTITKYFADPEIPNIKTLPALRTITAGLQIGI